MKKILNVLLAVVAFFGVTLVANAANNGKITIINSAENTDVTYNAYRVLDLSYNSTTKSYAYTINSDWTGFFTDENLRLVSYYTSKDNSTIYITEITEANAKTLAERALAYAKANNIAATGSTTINKGVKTGSIDNLPLGYYLVDSSLGALVHLDTTDTEATITEKNGEPTINKEVSATTNSIGEELTYTIVVDVKPGAENYKVTDTMTKGLTLDKTSFTFTYEGTAPTANPTPSYPTVNEGTKFVIDFSNTDLSEVTKITITYKATINADAVTLDEVNNTATLNYGNNNEITDEDNNVKLYQFQIKKTDDSKEPVALDGAEFKLYDAANGGNEIKLVKDGNAYRPALEGENPETIKAGEATVKGLAQGTYYLEEVVAPEGYTKLAARVPVQVSQDSTTVTPFNVVNTTHTQLTPTGGMGTVLFVTVGSLMTFACGIALVTKFRMNRFN